MRRGRISAGLPSERHDADALFILESLLVRDFWLGESLFHLFDLVEDGLLASFPGHARQFLLAFLGESFGQDFHQLQSSFFG